jgi:hypothetical protein
LGSLIIGISLIQLANGYTGTLIGIRLGVATLAPIVAGIVEGTKKIPLASSAFGAA